ncbi:MAG: hypothetical protein R3274_02010 [Desulfobacterales bacterium]|nr:hypothetical protein [Desulfobacterales bacterium]
MVITSAANIIVSDQRHYPVRPVTPANTAVSGENPVRRYDRYERAPLAKTTPGNHSDNRYTSNQFLQYADDYHIGRLIDLYA